MTGRVTVRQLIQLHLDRIAAFDRSGPRLNSIIALNPRALAQADSLDAVQARTGELVGPLHGIPIVVSDLIDAAPLHTTLGSATFRGSTPLRDAYAVTRLRRAGAIVIAKANVSEFGLSTIETLGSGLPGHTRNPYDPARVPGGADGGVAVAVSASFAMLGLGVDSDGSLRGPAAHTSLVAIRSTLGLTSRAGIVPLRRAREIAGPVARSVTDAVIAFEEIAGPDPADSISLLAQGRRANEPYTTFLVAGALAGARIGILHRFTDAEGADPEVAERYVEALVRLRDLGATTVEPIDIPALDSATASTCPTFATGLGRYLETLEEPPVSGIVEILESGAVHPTVEDALAALAGLDSTQVESACADAEAARARLRTAVRRTLLENRLDAIVYPTWSNPARLTGDLNGPAGRNADRVADAIGLPVITVPIGYTDDGLPAAIDFLGDGWTDWKLIALAYSFEQETQHRRPPPGLGPR